jgi:C-terminal processing protease CtpA/Prc
VGGSLVRLSKKQSTKRRTEMATRQKKLSQRSRKAETGARRQVSRKAPSYVKKLSTAVREHFAGATDLPTFLASAGELSPKQRKLIVQQALILIEQNYAHLPLKRAMHSIDPVQRLKLLLQTLEQASAATQPSEAEFHRELTEIFTSVRDLHTNYLLPSPFDQMTAFLPFMVEDYFDGGKRKYLVSHIAQGFNHPTFLPGVEVIYWNGIPIERAVMNNAYRYAGSNREARIARGVQTLTTRALRIALPPDEEWVIVGYRNAAGRLEELRVDWMVNPPLPSGVDADAGTELAAAAALGLDLEQDIIQRMRKALFAPQVVASEKKVAEKVERGVSFGDLESTLPQVFEARPVTTPAGTFGYIRIRTFAIWPPEDFVNEFIRLITALPQGGLIIDVRGNGGGVINDGEFILQTLTPRRVEPEPLQFINTPLNLEICRRNGPTSTWADLSRWVESMRQALQTGATFSAGFPISDPDECNAVGQKYFGPVVLITDALCYSTTDIFAAGFQDHEIGPILGADGNTGAGGANVWEHRYFVSNVLPGAGSVYQSLPNGAGMRVSIRRTLRVGRRAGTPVEDLGVIPEERHFMTRDDLLNGNVDLINKAGAMLAAIHPVRSLTVKAQVTSPTQATVVADTQGMTRLDVYLSDRPIQSIDIQGGQATFTVTKPDAAQLNLEILGFDGIRLVARYRTSV